MVLVPLPPWATESVAGAAESVKPDAAFTVRAMVVDAVRLHGIPQETGPLGYVVVPLIVTVTGPPVAAVLLAVSVSTWVVEVVPAAKEAVTPLGRPVALRATAPLNPPAGVTVMVLVPLLPWVTDRLGGDAESV
jgi:hypothetical protein